VSKPSPGALVRWQTGGTIIVIALAGFWVINNFHDLSSLRSLITFTEPTPENTSQSP
jgi:hypothetical protein